MNGPLLRHAALLALLLGCSSSQGTSTTTTSPASASSGSESVGATPAATTADAEVAPADAAVIITPADADAAVTTAADAAVATAGDASAATTTVAHNTATASATGGAAQGHAVLTRACGRCHEDDDPEGPNPNKNWDEARMRRQIRQGSARMRAIPASRLSDADLDLLIAYLRSTHAVR